MSIYSNGTLWLFGDVGSFEGGDHFTATMVRDALALHGAGPLTVMINSGGGFCSEGVAIHNMLKRHQANVTVVIDGVAASAGSLIAMAGDEIVVRRGSTIMLHDPASPSHGTAADHQRSFQTLDMIATEMAGIYAARSRKSVAEVRKLMVAETWLVRGGCRFSGLCRSRRHDGGARRRSLRITAAHISIRRPGWHRPPAGPQCATRWPSPTGSPAGARGRNQSILPAPRLAGRPWPT